MPIVVINNQFKYTNHSHSNKKYRLSTADLNGSIVITHAHNLYLWKELASLRNV